jgi:hypothetical protein
MTLVRFAALPALMGALVGTGAIGRLIPQDPYLQAAEDAGAEMLALPGFEDRYGSLEDDEAFSVGTELGIAAISRLPERELGEWLVITRELLAALDVESCATMVRGPDDADEATEAIRELDLETVERYFEVLLVGVELELSGVAGPQPPSPADRDAAFQLLSHEIGLARLEEIGAVMANPVGATDAEICAAGRDLYAGVAGLDAQHRSILLRLVTDPGAAT